MVAAHKLPAFLIPEIALCGQGTTPGAVGDRCRLHCLPGLSYDIGDALAQGFQVRGNQLAAGQVLPLQTHEARGVGMRKSNRQLFAGQAGAGNDPGQKVFHLPRPQQAQIHGYHHLLGAGGQRLVECLQPERGRSQGAVDASGALMGGSSPHAMVDADRRRDVAARDAGTALAARGIDVRQGSFLRGFLLQHP